jgi:transcriptional regulator with PAS, ATPase and Fis domain
VVVDCAALQEELLQSELFGHERGAFTGADRAKPGLFEVANGGTLFLDEIGEVSQATQVKLLRVLDTSSFRHVGGTTEIKVDARVVVATNRALATLARQGLFREDLYYRLSTITVELPPLRQRAGDVELLAEHFVARLNERYSFSRRLGPEAMALLRRHDWPGNVRELLHVIESAGVLCEGSEILPQHLPAALRTPVSPSPPSPEAGDRLPTLQEMERAHIERALRAAGGHRANAAKILGISERSLYRKLEEYRLS